MSHVHNNAKGFTLIELMLSMSFIAVLLLAIAMTIIQIGTIYNKGIIAKDLNQTARQVSDDFSRTASQSNDLTIATDLRYNSAGGRLCFGGYSYIWNTARAIQTNDDGLTRYIGRTNIPGLVKVPDVGRIYCSVTSVGGFVHEDIRAADANLSQELLQEGDSKLGVQQLTIIPESVVRDTTTNQVLYTLNLILGTGNYTAMNATQSACLTPGENDADPVYCTVQPFTIVLRTGSRG